MEDAPTLAAGNTIDVFAAVTADQQVLIGHDLIVNTVSGGSLTLLVPVADEAAWIAVGASNVAAACCAHRARRTAGTGAAECRRSDPYPVRNSVRGATGSATTP